MCTRKKGRKEGRKEGRKIERKSPPGLALIARTGLAADKSTFRYRLLISIVRRFMYNLEYASKGSVMLVYRR